MKTNKFFSAVFAALALVGFTACEPQPTPDEVVSVVLDQTTLTLEVGATATLKATVDPAGATVEWASQDPTVASVADGVVTGLAAGNTIIVASAGGKMASCIVKVNAAGTPGTGDNPGGSNAAQVKGTKIWPVVLDAVTAEANASKIVGDLRIDDTNNFLYIWAAGETYVAGEGTGLNFHGNTEGYVALTVAAPQGWSGLGFCLGEASAAAAEQLRQAIVANPDKYFLHIAMKATTPGNHQFYTFNDAATSFAVGTATIEKGQVIGDFTRDGSWAEFDVPMANFAAAMANLTFPTGGNIFCALSGAAVGSQLNLDAVYFYEK